MAIIKPFNALRPKPAIAKQVASRPYDVLNSEEAKEEAEEVKPIDMSTSEVAKKGKEAKEGEEVVAEDKKEEKKA